MATALLLLLVVYSTIPARGEHNLQCSNTTDVGCLPTQKTVDNYNNRILHADLLDGLDDEGIDIETSDVNPISRNDRQVLPSDFSPISNNERQAVPSDHTSSSRNERNIVASSPQKPVSDDGRGSIDPRIDFRGLRTRFTRQQQEQSGPKVTAPKRGASIREPCEYTTYT